MKLNHTIISLLFVFVFFTNLAFAKGKKPQLLVYGNDVEAFASALQSARSGVETYWVLPTAIHYKEWSLLASGSDTDTTRNLIGGIWRNVIEEINREGDNKDSVIRPLFKGIDEFMLESAVEKLIEEQAKLTVLKDVDVLRISRSKRKFTVQLSDRMRFSVLSVIDATSERFLEKQLLAHEAVSNLAQDSLPKGSCHIADLDANRLRTLLAIANAKEAVFALTMNDVLQLRNGNLFFTKSGTGRGILGSSLLARMNVGQAVGACASYCAFYKVDADKLDVRKVQAELLSFKSRLLPFIDVSIGDPNFAALQRMFLVSLLPWDRMSSPYLFQGEDTVAVASVRAVMLQLYTRAQLWFMDNEMAYFTVKDVVDLLKVVAFRSNELDVEVEKSWSRRFKFKTPYELDRLITRYEFAVLMDAYASPFQVRVNTEGVVVR